MDLTMCRNYSSRFKQWRQVNQQKVTCVKCLEAIKSQEKTIEKLEKIREKDRQALLDLEPNNNKYETEHQKK